jgi:hypothetical protein
VLQSKRPPSSESGSPEAARGEGVVECEIDQLAAVATSGLDQGRLLRCGNVNL